jgi:hypothetical protein
VKEHGPSVQLWGNGGFIFVVLNSKSGVALAHDMANERNRDVTTIGCSHARTLRLAEVVQRLSSVKVAQSYWRVNRHTSCQPASPDLTLENWSSLGPMSIVGMFDKSGLFTEYNSQG